MAEENLLNTRIALAQAKLNESFNISDDLEGNSSYRFLNKDILAEEYQQEAVRGKISEIFTDISKSIRDMRSSYLPIDYFLKYDRFISEVVNDIANQESYENAFMRILGMPSIGTTQYALSDEDSEIRSSEKLIMITPEGEKKEVSYEEIRTQILDERQKVKEIRKVIIDDSMYNISYLVPSLNDATSDIKIASIEKIETDFWKFSYLLIPPIQDINISNNINEADKITAPIFSDPRTRKINNSVKKPTLLETIIRIRLDRVSGTTSFVTGIESEIADQSIIDSRLDRGISFGSNSNQSIIDVESDSFGILESLFILRLRSAISGLAKKLYNDIDLVITEMEKSRRVPINAFLKSFVENFASDFAVVSFNLSNITNRSNLRAKDFISVNSNGEELTDDTLSSLEEQKLIEDSLIFLLGDRTEVLTLQSQTQRNSSIYDSKIMSGLVGIIDLPRKRIAEESRKIIDARNKASNGQVDTKIQEIGTVLGTDIGVGTIDVAIFALALFALPEKSLLGLLSNKQYQRLRTGEFKSLIADQEKQDTVTSLNELTELVYNGYQAFIQDLKS